MIDRALLGFAIWIGGAALVASNAHAGQAEDADRAVGCIMQHDYLSQRLLDERLGRMADYQRRAGRKWQVCVNGACTAREDPYYGAMEEALPDRGARSVHQLGERCLRLIDEYEATYGGELELEPLS